MGNEVKVTSPCDPYLRPHLHTQPKTDCEIEWRCMTPEERQKWVEDQASKVLEVKIS